MKRSLEDIILWSILGIILLIDAIGIVLITLFMLFMI